MLDEGLVQAYVFYLVFDQGGIGVAYNNYMNPYGYNNNMYSDPDADEGKVFRIWKSRYVS